MSDSNANGSQMNSTAFSLNTPLASLNLMERNRKHLIMSTVNPRMNVTLEPRLAEEVDRLSAQENISTAKMLR